MPSSWPSTYFISQPEIRYQQRVSIKKALLYLVGCWHTISASVLNRDWRLVTSARCKYFYLAFEVQLKKLEKKNIAHVSVRNCCRDWKFFHLGNLFTCLEIWTNLAKKDYSNNFVEQQFSFYLRLDTYRLEFRLIKIAKCDVCWKWFRRVKEYL